MSKPYRLAGLLLTDHEFTVPLDHARPQGPQIQVFAREVADPEALTPGGTDKPFLVYFQGGPGFEAIRPIGASGWIKRALEEYRVLLLDQRGTGRSTQGHRKVGTDHSFSWRMKGFNSIQLRFMPMNGVDSPPRHSDN